MDEEEFKDEMMELIKWLWTMVKIHDEIVPLSEKYSGSMYNYRRFSEEMEQYINCTKMVKEKLDDIINASIIDFMRS